MNGEKALLHIFKCRFSYVVEYEITVRQRINVRLYRSFFFYVLMTFTFELVLHITGKALPNRYVHFTSFTTWP